MEKGFGPIWGIAAMEKWCFHSPKEKRDLILDGEWKHTIACSSICWKPEWIKDFFRVPAFDVSSLDARDSFDKLSKQTLESRQTRNKFDKFNLDEEDRPDSGVIPWVRSWEWFEREIWRGCRWRLERHDWWASPPPPREFLSTTEFKFRRGL